MGSDRRPNAEFAPTRRVTVAEAIVRFFEAQRDGSTGETLCGGVFAIFGHGNVAGLGLALERSELPVWRAHNEQAMALAATGYAKALRRRRFLACTTSIGPGATNLVTAAATARVNRLPLLLLVGEAFASRRVDPALQQLEADGDPSVTVNDCLRPVSAYFDRIQRADQVSSALEAAIRVLMDPVRVGPVTLCLPQDVQTELVPPQSLPESFFAPTARQVRRPAPDPSELTRAADALRRSKRLAIVAGGGVRYSGAEAELASFATTIGAPVVETPAGRGVFGAALGGVGVAGTLPANRCVQQADTWLAIGTRLSDFTTGSRRLTLSLDAADEGSTSPSPTLPKTIVHLNVDARDAAKLGGLPLVADAAQGISALHEALAGFEVDAAWRSELEAKAEAWWSDRSREPVGTPPADGAVIDAVARFAREETVIVAASGSIPGELQKRWRNRHADALHLEYGFSCMGYEIAGALGVKMARPASEVVALVGDGAYLMLNSELQTSVALDAKLVVVVFDNGGFGCIHRLQTKVGGRPFANLRSGPPVDLAAHARSLGCDAERVDGIEGLEAALDRARSSPRTVVIVVPTDADRTTEAGGAWWDVPSLDDDVRGAGS